MNKSEIAELKRLTKAVNQMMGKVKNLEKHVLESHRENVEGSYTRANQHVKSKGKKGRKPSSSSSTEKKEIFYCSCRRKPYSKVGMHGDADHLGHIVTAKAKGHKVKTEAEYNKLSKKAKKEFHSM